MKQIWKYQWYDIVLLIGIALLTGCGFRLRHAVVIASEFTPLYVQAQPNSNIANALNEMLRINDVPYTTDIKIAKLTIHIINESHSNRVVAVNSYGKVISTEINYRVTFEGIMNNGQIIMPSQTIDVFREYVNPEVEVLGKSEEAYMIKSNLEQDVADRILRRLYPSLQATPLSPNSM